MTEKFRVEKAPLDTIHGRFNFYCFSWGPHEEDHVLCIVNEPLGSAPLVRIQSACYTAEIFRSLDCDCHEQLEVSFRRISAEGGLLIYMLCDGRGAGLLKKVRGLGLGHTHGLDTADAYAAMGIDQDLREYGHTAEILRHFEVNRMRLLTNNPRKIHGLREHGIQPVREPLEIRSTPASRNYLRTKAVKMGHLLSEFSRQ
jgi:GTP cyclohydrolase II